MMEKPLGNNSHFAPFVNPVEVGEFSLKARFLVNKLGLLYLVARGARYQYIELFLDGL